MPANVLVVDDEKDIAAAWKRTLSLVGYKVITANDANTAIKLSEDHPIDVVILDYMMPSMSGIKLLNEIRKEHPFVRSIIVSGKLDQANSESDVLDEIKTNIEVDIYLHKPVDNAKLKEALMNLLTDGAKDWRDLAKAKSKAAKSNKTVKAAERDLSKRKKS